MKRAWRWGLAAAAAAGLTALLVGAFQARRGARAEEERGEQPIRSAARLSRTAAGETVLRLEPATQQRIGLETRPLQAAWLAPEVAAYGRLEEDPARSFVVRAPVAGTLQLAASHAWPALGQTLGDGDLIGSIEPRLAPAERVNLTERLAVARADVEASRASAAAAQAAYHRARTLNADNRNMSDRAVEEAEARWKGEEARLTAASRNARLLEASLASASGPAASAPLRAARGGQVVELVAQPGESVEAGQPLLRLARFDGLLARVYVPAGERLPDAPPSARVVAFGEEDHPVTARLVALAPAIDPLTQGRGFLFRLSDSGRSLRPGAAVTAFLPLAGARRRGVAVPRAALLRYQGRIWVYLQLSGDRFARREVPPEDLRDGGWSAAAPPPGTRVVVAGAQTLLSEEFKFQIQVGEENPE